MSLEKARIIIKDAKYNNSNRLNLWNQNLTDKDLIELHFEIKEIKDLTSLYLGDNNLLNVEFLKELTTLISLDLSSNNLTNVEFLKELTTLTSLSLRNNNLLNVESLKALTNLISLDLSSNNLTNVEFLKELTTLTELYLSFNNLTNVESLKEHKNLRYLNLIGNKELEKIIGREILEDKGNPQAILSRYFEQIVATEKFPIDEARMVLIGQGFVGKTSLRKCLIDGNCQDDEVKTEGLEVKEWEIDYKDNRKVKLNVWDFGGQEVYHASHKFFFRNRCLFVLVLDVGDRTENNTNKFKYWLNTIESLVKDDKNRKAPVIIICNKAEKHLAHFAQNKITDEHKQIEINNLLKEFIVIEQGKDIVEYLNERYKKLEIKGVYATSCKQDKIVNVDLVRNGIVNELEDLGVSDTETREFINDKENVKNYPKNYIYKKEFAKVCPQRTDDRLYQFSRFGIITTFDNENDELKDLIILKPKWLTQSIYKILSTTHKLGDSKGIASKTTIRQILSEKEIIENNEVDEVIKLMENFHLCARRNNKEYFFPSFFPTEKPNFPLTKTKSVCVKYSFTLLPDNFITQFLSIVLANPIYTPEYWRTGVILTKDTTRACIEADLEKDTITIEVEGKFENRNKFLNDIKKILNELFVKNKNVLLENEEISVPNYEQECRKKGTMLDIVEYKMIQVEELNNLLSEGINEYQVAGLGKCDIRYLLHEIEGNKFGEFSRSKKDLQKENEQLINENRLLKEMLDRKDREITIMNQQFNNKDSQIASQGNENEVKENTFTQHNYSKEEVTKAIADLQAEVANNTELEDSQKTEISNQLATINSYIDSPIENKLKALTAMTIIATSYSHIANTASIWGTTGDLICKFFGIPNPFKIP